jgi:hypothetical protein
METYIVTVKLERHSDHDPANKQTGECPVSSRCTDVTGQHHSFLTQGLNEKYIRERLEAEPNPIHVTRIEKARIDLASIQ